MFTDSASAALRTSAAGTGRDEELPAAPFRIVTCGRTDAGRQEAEHFVQERFRRTHGASIHTFMPSLLVVADEAARILGVAGCRRASDERLYLERYIDRPIEELLATATGARIQRHQIVEIGNFACRDPRVARKFMSMLSPYLLGQEYSWITFTATISIRRILRHLGARCVDLGPANGACARGGADEWGRYYANDPRVMAGYLPLARRIPALWSAWHAD